MSSSEDIAKLMASLDNIEGRLDVLNDDLMTVCEAVLFHVKQLRSLNLSGGVDDDHDVREHGVQLEGEAPLEGQDSDPQGDAVEVPEVEEAPFVAKRQKGTSTSVIQALMNARRALVPRGTSRRGGRRR